MAVKRDQKLTKDFRKAEFKCRCRRADCTAPGPDPDFLIKLQRLRDLWGKPLVITSGSRCKSWNAKVLGSPVSQHLLGKAVDIRLDSPEDGPKLQALAEKVGMGGIGLGSIFIHVDSGPSGRRWTY